MAQNAPGQLDIQLKLGRIHETAPVERNLDILYSDVHVGPLPFLEAYRDAMSATGSRPRSFKQLRRPLRAFALPQYFGHALDLDGDWAECGVMKGFSALLMLRLAAGRRSGFTGAGCHLIDSFEGLSAPTKKDAVKVERLADGTKRFLSSHRAGAFAVPLDTVRGALRNFSEVAYHKGWIPEVFTTLSEQQWAFVHVDVDLYVPTLASLEYFYPRLMPGGIIVNDDYMSPLFPGGERSWDEYCQAHDIPFVVLDSGQSVLIKD